MDEQMIAAAAKELSGLLKRQLDDFGANTISLTRDQALLAQGLVEAVIEIMAREQRT